MPELDDAGTARVLVIRPTGKHFRAGMALDVFDDLGLLDAKNKRAGEFDALAATPQL